MTASVANLLESFDRLSEPERHEAVTEIMRRVAELDYPPLDDAMTHAAAMTFEELDARESAVEGA
jgi:hypothetical protein